MFKIIIVGVQYNAFHINEGIHVQTYSTHIVDTNIFYLVHMASHWKCISCVNKL